ncbi:MAG: peptide chain release factor N(5)-glutamine methyltransferase [Phycisphaeraceae bacterium]|nr:MAG: peptide chain release factor N(5)-glutamine methyltransferase [Phycisphaeraceae bacterium]
MATAAGEVWTTRRLLLWMRQTFTSRGIDAPGLTAEMLLAHVLGCDRLRLHMEADRPASGEERERLRDLVGRALKHEPVQYLVGEGWFFGMPFTVDRRVLIPRPGSGTIVEAVLEHARVTPAFGGPPGKEAGEGVLIADIGTGSGCLAVTLLKRLPRARAVATDLSAGALEVARENASRHGVSDRIDFIEGDMVSALDRHPVAKGAGTVHYLVSNPPYIPDHEWAAVEPNVRCHEPESALRGGADGLRYVRVLIEEGPRVIRPGGLLLVETADSTASTACGLAGASPDLEGARVLTDFEGLPRVVMARRLGGG